MNPQEQAARKLSDECDKVIVEIANRNPAGLSGEFLSAFRAGYGYGVAALESQLSQARSQIEVAENAAIAWRECNKRAELALSQAQAELTELRKGLAAEALREIDGMLQGKLPVTAKVKEIIRAALKEGDTP